MKERGKRAKEGRMPVLPQKKNKNKKTPPKLHLSAARN
jgi:hypothetical protein